MTVAGNTFTRATSFGVYLLCTTCQVYLTGNTINNTAQNGLVTINKQNQLFLSKNHFVNTELNGQGRIQVAYVTNAYMMQFTENIYSQTTTTTSYRILEVISATNLTIDNSGNTTLTTVLPSKTTPFPLPKANSALLFQYPITTEVIQLKGYDLVSSSNASLLVAYGASGGRVDTSFDRNTVTFTFDAGQTVASFQFTILGSMQTTYGVDVGTVQLLRHVPVVASPAQSKLVPVSSPRNSTRGVTSNEQSSMISSMLYLVIIVVGLMNLVFQ